VRSASAQALTDIIARDHQVAPIVAFASHGDVDVGIVSVPVVDPNPIELRAEIPLGLRHQVPCKCPEVGELIRILRGHDESKMMAIIFTAIGERAVIRVVALRIEHPAGGTVLRYAIPA
jgi:hypothetical protein